MSYGGVAKTLHWTVACLLVMQFPLAWTMPRVATAQAPDSLDRFHVSIGMSVLGVMLLRLAWRLVHRAPPLPDDLPRWQCYTSRLVHGLLYAELLAAPAAGWAWASAKGWPIVFLGVVPLPGLLVVGSRLARFAAAAHQVLAWTILALIGLHLLAVSYHALIRRDDIVGRMLPR
jgi:cytochrome b561